MIPFASQRGLGQDLATHLLNEHENEDVELAGLRGSIAPDLHGAFKEWEIIARECTRCRKYLYSLSVNPDPAQEALTREQYEDYIARAEAALGLTGQPRAVIFHVKDGREHCHVIWSRIDAAAGKAVPLRFDRQKLMRLTREFARDHGLQLPRGYDRDSSREGGGDQLSLYELYQQRTTGLSKEDRMEEVTDAWRGSDSPKSFVQALAARGYILATGDRPYVLVDLYGHVNALPRLIDDRTVRLKHIRAFLEPDFPPDSLPTVEEARALAARHRERLEAGRVHEQQEAALEELERAQADRRAELTERRTRLRQRQHQDRQALAARHRIARDALYAAYRAQQRLTRRRRHRNRLTGLAAFLARVSGLEAVRRAIHRYRDRMRYAAYCANRARLRERQAQERRELGRRHRLQSLDLARRETALAQIDRRERQALEEALLAELRIGDRGGRPEIPAINVDALMRGRGPDRYKPDRHHDGLLIEAFEDALTRRIRPPDLEEAFTRAAEGRQDDGESDDSGEGPHPDADSTAEHDHRPRAPPPGPGGGTDRQR